MKLFFLKGLATSLAWLTADQIYITQKFKFLSKKEIDYNWKWKHRLNGSTLINPNYIDRIIIFKTKNFAQ